MSTPADDLTYMQRALEIAWRGQGYVEPNPMVGCVIVNHDRIVGEGWHESYGGPHAEVHAMTAAGQNASGGTMYVTLEPCCHHGKTPPCTEAIRSAGLRRVVVAHADPFVRGSGHGIHQLQQSGIAVEQGVLQSEVGCQLAPYLKLVTHSRPWVVAKWAMTLDGKTAAGDGSSRWISGAESRAVTHQLRGRVDAIVVGSRTACLDDPLLTARPPGPRRATRFVVDSQLVLSTSGQLVRSARQVPVLIATSNFARSDRVDQLRQLGCEVLICAGGDHLERLAFLLDELGRREITNVLVEGGGRLLANFLAIGELDEVHVFVGGKIAGGSTAPSPVQGAGCASISQALALTKLEVRQVGDDAYLHGRLNHGGARS